ncbi:MAG: ribosome silencing factor [Polyangiaceae bacterium]
MATKKRSDDTEKTTKKADAPAKPRAPKATTAAGAARKATAVAAAKGSARPRLKASHASASGAAPRARRAASGPGVRKKPIAAPQEKSARAPTSKRAPLAAPKRAKAAPTPPTPSNKAQELAVAIAVAGLDKKAIAIEILDVTGKVDYADFLVVMTGRSDRHVHSIATGIEEALARKNKVKPLSVEGLSTATWVLIDFGDVVVHVFQEDSRRLYDIEGLWIDAGRVALPEEQQRAAAQVDADDRRE